MKKLMLVFVSLLILASMSAVQQATAETTPTIKVEPEICVRAPYAVWPNYVNKTFDVNVTINDVDSEEKLVAADFFLTYNKTLLEVVSVTEGPFFQDPRWDLEGTLFKYYVETLPDGTGVVMAMDLIYPSMTAGKTYDDWLIFPNGSGTIATITFRSIYQPVAPQPSESCDLGFSETLLCGWIGGINQTEISHNVQDGKYEVIVLQLPRTPIDVNIDVGKIYFKGEITEFYILTSDYGMAVDPTSIKAYLYYNGTLFADLTDAIKPVTTGLYRIAYTIPSDAEFGTYTLLAEAEFFEAKGTNIESFQISSTLEQLEASVTEINDNIATIVIPNLGQIKLNLTAVDAKLTEVKGTVGVINSTAGTIYADIRTLNATVTGLIVDSKGEILANITTTLNSLTTKLNSIDGKIVEVKGDVATVSTTLGEFEVKLDDTQSAATTTLYVTSALSAIAVILAAAILILFTRKH